METKVKTHKQVFDDYLRKLEEEAWEKDNAFTDADEVEEMVRLERLWSSVGLFDHNINALDYCYIFGTEQDAWAFYRYIVGEEPNALNLSVSQSSYDELWTVA